MKRKYIIIAIVIPVAFFLSTFGQHEKEDGSVEWQTALLPGGLYDEKYDKDERSQSSILKKDSHSPTPEERGALELEVHRWKQKVPEWPLVSQFVEENPIYSISLHYSHLDPNGNVKPTVYALENDLIKELNVTYNYDDKEFVYTYMCYNLLGSSILIEKSRIHDMDDIEDKKCLEFTEKPPKQHSNPPSNEEGFKTNAILEMMKQKFLEDPLVSQFIEENPKYKLRVDSGLLWYDGTQRGSVYSFENDFIEELEIILENNPENTVYTYMCYNPGENEWGEKSRVYDVEDMEKQECHKMANDSTSMSSELPNLEGSAKTEKEILMWKQVMLDDPLVSKFIEENPKHNMVLHKGILNEEGRVQYEIFAWEDDLIKKLEIIHEDNREELVYVYICYNPGENIGHNKYQVYDMEAIENQNCYMTYR